ncbi:MAG: response regulator transcription factor [Acutalibacteraceae bacterium]|nr:response regulator transcription factor [Acutalibacteraceae bacterium]
MFRILVAEDDRNVARLMQLVLKNEGFDVILAENGRRALELLDSEHIDVILLDIMMPEINGFEFLETIRANNIETPVIVTSAKNLPEDRCQGFISGADDYIVKPVDERELVLRIKALLKRTTAVSEQVLSVGQVTLDYNALTVTRGQEKQTLPKKEFYLLFKLLSSPDKIFTRIQLMDEIWGMNSESSDTTVNVHINRLRKRFGDYSEFSIVAIKGIGYKAVINVENAQ